MDEEEEINFQDVEHVFHTFLRQHCENEVMEILNAENELEHYSLHVNALELFDMNMLISTQLLKVPLQLLPVFERAAFKVQRECLRDLVPNESQYSMSVKTNCHVRLSNLPICPELTRNRLPQSEDVGTFLAFSGTVIRCSIAKLLEYERQFMCNKCRHVFTVEVEFEQNYNLPTPTSCPSSDGCNSYKFTEMKDGKGPSKCKDYQELKVQEQVQRLDVGTIPRSIVVIMEDDLVDKCKPGDDVTVSGVVLRRWQNVYQDTRCQIEIVIKASDVIISNDQRSSVTMTDQHRREFEYFWEENRHSPLKGRNEILSGFCPQVYGLYVVKLAVTIALIGGVQRVKESGTRIRGESHLLLVGDPGTGKSQFLKYAAKVMPRSVLTTGIGSTSAGLTVTAVKDSGEWQLEAGALVLADGGICCIDEFNSIREHDRTSIHEAMEQQTISVAKAGLVCKLNTRTTILAATNPKGKYDRHESVSVNVALASPLLSRFDVVLVLIDKQNEDWDRIISNFILRRRRPTASIDFWSLDRMQAYFSFVKRKAPTLSEDSMRILRAYYQGQRSADLRNAARTTIRLLESMIRISEAHARLMFREEVTIQDAVMAVCIMECSMQNTALLQGLMNPLHTSFPKDADAEYIDQATVILNKLKLNDILEKVLEYERERKIALLRSRRNNSSDHDASHNSSTNESHQKSFRSVSNDSQIKTNNRPLGSQRGNCDGESMDTANNQTVNAFQKSFTAANSDSLTPLTNQEQEHVRITTPPANQKSLLDMFQLEEEDKEDDPIWQHFISTQTSSSSTKTKADKKTTSADEGGLVVPKKKKTFFRNTQSASASGKSKSGDNNNNEKRLMDEEHGTHSSKQNTSFKMTNPAKTKNVLKTKNTFFTGENLDDEAIDDFFRLEEDISKQTKMAETKNGNHITESRNLTSFKTNTKIQKTFRVPFQMRAQPAPSDKCNDDESNGNSDKSELHQRPSKSNVECVENKASPIVDSPPDLADFDKDSLWDDEILNSSLSSTKTNKNKNSLNSTSQKDDAYADTLLITTQERITPDFTAFPPRKRNKPFELKEFDIVNTTTESQLAARVMDVQTPTTRNNNELENTGPKGKLKRFKFRKK